MSGAGGATPVRLRAGKAPCGQSGQMTVELAVLVPVVIVVALIVVNLMEFVDACAAFDRLSLDGVIAEGVSPAGEQSVTASVAAVEDGLRAALGREGTCDVEVRAEHVSAEEGGRLLSVSPLLTRYTCTLVFRPWPRELRLPGITYAAPLELRHERTLVIDRYRPGVVV
ncbi:MAG: hypothetical protein MR874_06995 [Coriobacteriaceae bacterium]|nr:hypothetical protein [Coriobacteriaceae bacterium]